jgi:3-oxoacyl-[acyl-carrier protein] reductase
VRLAGRVALVTGAGRGVGRAVAVALAREGAALVLAARTARDLDAVAREISGAGGHALAVPADVRQEQAVAALVTRALEVHGHIDLLVAAAGTAAFGPLAETAPDAWDQMLAVNLRGAFLCCRAVLPAMAARRSGTIILIGSVVTSRTLPGTAAYTASKYGLLGMARVLAEEARPHGVRVGVLSAGAVDTALWDQVTSSPDRARMLRPEQVAEAALLIATQAPNASLEELTILPAAGILGWGQVLNREFTIQDLTPLRRVPTPDRVISTRSPGARACWSGTRMPVPVESTVPGGMGLSRQSHSTSSGQRRLMAPVLTAPSQSCAPFR